MEQILRKILHVKELRLYSLTSRYKQRRREKHQRPLRSIFIRHYMSLKKSQCLSIGKILKTHGVKGELSVKFDPLWANGRQFLKQKVIFAEIYPGNDLVPFFIEFAEADKNGMGRIKFEDYDNKESLAELTNKEIFVPGENMKAKPKKKQLVENFQGFEVCDKVFGFIGIVHELQLNQPQEMLVIRKGSDEILIPFAEELIENIDEKKKIILVKIPEGLLDINKSG